MDKLNTKEYYCPNCKSDNTYYQLFLNFIGEEPSVKFGCQNCFYTAIINIYQLKKLRVDTNK